ncbi:hypothetical protein GC231_25210 (plasmid) [Escherichia coli]|nr:hypothetical protein [Escherichia coli]MBW9702656.1 hypothetical protein [Escherichia coli]MBW9712536.1 hypothetical protein [Escherichia coli]MBW9717960.1 hypothetical protein [Escherichia coli]MBW9727128.1 hypothetical protein [Escherichia coli]
MCKATAPDGAAVSACLPPHCGPFSADGLSGGTYTTTSRFSRPGERCTSHKTFCCHERCNSDPHPTPEIRSRG